LVICESTGTYRFGNGLMKMLWTGSRTGNSVVLVNSKKLKNNLIMAKNEKIPLKKEQLEEDLTAYINLQDLKDYSPRLEEYSMAMITAVKSKMDLAFKNLEQTERRLKEYRQMLVAAEWEFHNMILGSKEQVIGQYGSDSNEIQALGRKKKSDYKAPKRKSSTNKPKTA